MMEDVFCKIIKGEMDAEVVHRDDDIIVIKDIHPQAPVHLLVIPVTHYDGLGDFNEADDDMCGKMLQVAHRVAMERGLDKGYRLIINEGEHGGKLVPHLHMHLLGGKKLGPKIVA